MSEPTTDLPKVLLFDVIETLLDLEPLEESINAVLLENNAAKLWFTTLLHYSLVLTVGGQFRPFPEIGIATLQMMARNRNVVLSDADAKKALEPMMKLAPHPDVRPALEALRNAGFRMATLANATCAGLRAQLAHAGIADFFERQLSVETVGKYKPHLDVYRWAAEQMQVQPGECMLVAAHPWDVAGAAWAGMRTAFLARAGTQTFALAPAPDIQVLDTGDLAKRLGAAPMAAT